MHFARTISAMSEDHVYTVGGYGYCVSNASHPSLLTLYNTAHCAYIIRCGFRQDNTLVAGQIRLSRGQDVRLEIHHFVFKTQFETTVVVLSAWKAVGRAEELRFQGHNGRRLSTDGLAVRFYCEIVHHLVNWRLLFLTSWKNLFIYFNKRLLYCDWKDFFPSLRDKYSKIYSLPPTPPDKFWGELLEKQVFDSRTST